MDARTITANASADNLTDDDYRDMFDELRGGKGLDPFCAMINSAYSKGTWSKYERQKAKLNRTMRNELRRALDQPPLPPTVAEAIASVSPDALVVSVTDAETPDRVILAHSGDGSQIVHMNGEISVEAGVTTVTSEASTKPRKPVYRPRLSVDLRARIETDGRTVAQIIEAGLESRE